MNAEEVAEILKDVKYRGRLQAKDHECLIHGPGSVILRWIHEEVDSSDENMTDEFVNKSKSLVLNTRDEVLKAVYDLIVIGETHEIKEKLRYQGRPIMDAHPELYRRDYAWLPE